MLKRVRLTCCSSTSTWAKSVLTVMSAFKLAVTPYLASSPKSRSKSFSTCGVRSLSVVTRPIAYGFSSTRALDAGRSRPTSVAAREIRKMLFDPPPIGGSAVRWVHSFLRRIDRRS